LKAAVVDEEASPKFSKELERTVWKSNDLVENPSVVENCEEISNDQDPTPSVTT
jgi:hypothetical protein